MKSKYRPGLGISWLWQLPDSHPFHHAAVWHDWQYELRKQGGLAGDKTSKRIDKQFYKMCRNAAGDDIPLKVQAAIFYRLTRIWGPLFWPKHPK